MKFLQIIKKQIKKIISLTINLEKVFEHHGLKYDDKEINDYLFKEKISEEIKNDTLNKNENAIMYAALSNKLELFKDLLKYHIEIDIGHNYLLRKCIVKGHFKIAYHILKNNSVKIPTYLEETIAHYIIVDNDLIFLDFYLEYLKKYKSEFDIQYIKKDFLNVLFKQEVYNLTKSKVDWLDELTKRGFIFYLHDIKGMVHENQNEMVFHLLNNEIDRSEFQEKNLMLTSIKKNNFLMFKFLYENRMNKEIIGKEILLIYGAEKGNVEIVEFLLNNESLDINGKAKTIWAENSSEELIRENKFSPLEAAIIGQKKETINYLLDKGAFLDLERIVELHNINSTIITSEMLQHILKWENMKNLTKELNKKELTTHAQKRTKL